MKAGDDGWVKAATLLLTMSVKLWNDRSRYWFQVDMKLNITMVNNTSHWQSEFHYDSFNAETISNRIVL